MKNRQQLIAGVFKALGHSTRLAIVTMLKDGERCVCELVEQVGQGNQSNISQHLALLRRAGLLQSRKEGLSVYYRLRYPEVAQLIGCAERLLLLQLEETQRSLSTSDSVGGESK
ncbi:MAG: ArsR/SmtB family transcription factor [Bacillota bacterium]|jgi:DNA-binding transcriptional ArsR family regulator